MNKWQKYKYDILIALILIAFAVFIIFARNEYGVLSDRDAFENFIKGFGILAPLVIILIIVIEVIFAPLPGYVPALSAGFVFGPIEGAIYAYIGNILGSTIAFFIARKYGKRLILKFVKNDKLDKYEAAIKRREGLLLFLYFIPVFPTDILSLAFGLSNIKYRKFIFYMGAGYLFYVLLMTYFGDYLANLYFNL